MVKEIEKSWNEFLAKPFPDGYAGTEVEGVELASLATFAAGCVDTFIHNTGRPGRRKCFKD